MPAGNSDIKETVNVISSDPPCKHDKAYKSFVVKRTLLTFNEGSLEIGWKLLRKDAKIFLCILKTFLQNFAFFRENDLSEKILK